MEPEPTPVPPADVAPPPAPASDPIETARQFEAAELLREADKAFDENRLTAAADRYGRLVGSYGSQLTPEQATRAAWNGMVWELYGFIALVFFIFCFSMSRYSMYLERRLQTDH